MPTPPWVAERRRPTDDERKKYEDSLTPEQKEQYRQMREMMRARMAEGGGPRGGGGGGGGESGGPGGGGSGGGFGGMFGGAQRSNANDGPAIRTVYVLDKERSTTGKPVLKAVVVKTGIADGTNTEIQEGLAEGEVLVTGLKTTTTTATAPTANPFGPSFGPRR
jgi:hypothetical protein